MKVVVTSKENDIAVYYCSDIIENDGMVSFINVKGNDVEVNKRVAKEIEIMSIYFEGGKR